jgi:hypothetical protein
MVEKVMDYAKLRQINVNEHTEKKGNLTYLSWTWAVDQLLQQDPMATWEFPEPSIYNDTMMVYCQVTALGKTMRMHLPVMDNRNNAIKSPDARKISDSMMRCLAKCIATFGIGLYIYAGSDLPEQDAPDLTKNYKDWCDAIQLCANLDELKRVYQQGVTDLKADKELLEQFVKVKDQRKGELSE